jgi:hypothetical protein
MASRRQARRRAAELERAANGFDAAIIRMIGRLVLDAASRID